jgi:hypothetical protein
LLLDQELETDRKNAQQSSEFTLTRIELGRDFALLENALDRSKLSLGSQT